MKRSRSLKIEGNEAACWLGLVRQTHVEHVEVSPAASKHSVLSCFLLLNVALQRARLCVCVPLVLRRYLG